MIVVVWFVCLNSGKNFVLIGEFKDGIVLCIGSINRSYSGVGYNHFFVFTPNNYFLEFDGDDIYNARVNINLKPRPSETKV